MQRAGHDSEEDANGKSGVDDNEEEKDGSSSGKIAMVIRCAGKVMVIRLIKGEGECLNIEDKAELQIKISKKHILIQSGLKRDLILIFSL